MIETQRLILRPWRTGDIVALGPFLSDPQVMRFSDTGPLDATAIEGWLKRNMAASDGWLSRAIERKDSGDVIGYVSLSHDPGRVRPGDAELGIRLARSFWGRGYAGEAARGMIALGWADPNVERIVAIVDPHNTRSVRLLDALGLAYEREIAFDGYDHPDLVYVTYAPRP